MSNEFEKNDDLLSATPADRLKQLIEQVSGDKDAPEGLLELLKRMSEDPDLDALVRDNKEEAARKEAVANEYADSIHAFFEGKGWHYTALDSKGRVMLLGFKMRNSTVRLQIIVGEDAECIRFNIQLFTCLEEYRLAMSEYITELNHPLRYGAFHIDKEDGEVTYRYSVSYKDLPFSAESFEGYIDACTVTTDRNYRELSRIANGKFSDEEKKDWFRKIKQFAIALSQ